MSTTETEVAAAMAQAEADSRHRQEYYQANHGVPAGSTGENVNRPLPLPDDPAVTGVQPGGAR